MLRNLVRKLLWWRKNRDIVLNRVPEDAVCAEIGVFKGDFAARILAEARPTVLHLIDPWKYEEDPTYRDAWYGGQRTGGQHDMEAIFEAVRERFAEEMEAGIVHLHRAPSSSVCSQFPDEYFDWVYIDGNHLYDFVKADLEGFYPKVKSGGYITGDDYGMEGWWHDGVTRAVDEFIASGRCDMELLDQGQYILR